MLGALYIPLHYKIFTLNPNTLEQILQCNRARVRRLLKDERAFWYLLKAMSLL